ncbi:MAG: hypothetical protein HYT40_02865 [Candidatus Sungbacteria bacterium]|uniref:Uncharacterized protein n=1 Tax=Candidatus Sungiibacteriota bacterium TaxID=2750080 RepID=A0A931SE71_9BACT|nr:hypothetical protein [Candidatus Sungbacteria bacterium]
MKSSVVTIPKKVSGGEELVVVRKDDFEAFRNWRKEVENALAKVQRGRREYRLRKARVVASPRELL